MYVVSYEYNSPQGWAVQESGMIEQGLPFAVVAGIVLASFVLNVAFGMRVSDAFNAGAIEINTPWRRPRLLAGRPLVALWFAAALAFLATLPGVVGIDAAAAAVASGPAIGAIALMTVAAVTYKRSLAQQPTDALDEREREVRDSLYLISYRIVASVLVGVGIAGYAAIAIANERIDWDAIAADALIGGAVLAATFIWVLPSLVHAWHDRRPDEVNDETREAWRAARRELRRALRSGSERRRGDGSSMADSAGPGSTMRA